MSERKWTSPSQLGSFSRCELAWYFEKVERRPYRRGWRAVAGTAMGEFCNQSCANLMSFGEHLSAESVPDIVSQAFDDSWAKETPAVKDTDPSREACKAQAIDAATVWLAELALKVMSPVSVEPRIEMSLDFVEPDLLMYADLIDAMGSGKLAVYDWKFKGAKVNESEAHFSHQLTAYAWACDQPGLVMNGTIPLTSEGCESVALGCVVSLKTKTYSQFLQSKRHAGDVEQFKRAIWVMEERIATGIFKGADPNYGYACGPDNCAHWMYCPHGSRDVTLHQIKTGGVE